VRNEQEAQMDEALELRKILLRLADDFERRERTAATFAGETEEEAAWLRQEFAKLSSEGSVSAGDPGPSPGYRFTQMGYTKYLPQITAWRSGRQSSSGLETASPDLDVGLLYRMMRHLGSLRALPREQINTTRFESLLEDCWNDEGYDERHRHVNRHLEFLERSGFILVKARLGDEDWAGIGLTLSGQTFVQPALAEFGREPLLPEVVKSIEQQIHALTRPPGEKETLLFKLRAAISKQAPDLVVKFLVELTSKMLKPDGS
jgi:hypothetical protein